MLNTEPNPRYILLTVYAREEMKSVRTLKGQLKTRLARLLRIPAPYTFQAASSIVEQTMKFHYKDKTFEVSADSTTPLYESVLEIVDYDCYQLKYIDFEDGLDEVVIDIGGNIGITALVFSQFQHGIVYCFEPVAMNWKWIEMNLRRNSITNVQIVQKAVTAVDGTIRFSVDPNDSAGGHVSAETDDDQRWQRIEVESVSLGKIFELIGHKSIGLMKIDCEGGEYDIINQIDKATAKRIKNITMEIHDLNREKNVYQMRKSLENLGYRLTYLPDVFRRRGLHHLLASVHN